MTMMKDCVCLLTFCLRVCCLMLSIWNVKICAVLLIVKNQDINPEEELRIISFLKSIPAFTML